MTRVVLINPPYLDRENGVWQDVASVMPPQGLAWIAAVLEREGIPVAVVDAHAERVPPDAILERLTPLEPMEILGITATSSLVSNALEIARRVKRAHPGVKIVLGGVHPTVMPEEVLAEEAVDWVVRGEGEATMLEIARDEPLEGIRGLSYRRDGEILHNPDRPLLEDLDALPMPAYHLLPMDRYYPAAGAYRRLPAMSVLATRGCYGRCTFCYRIFGQRLRCRSGRLVAQEVQHLQQRYGIREICFYDDTFSAVRKEVLAFCDALEELGVDLTWSCFSRVDAVDEGMLRRMKAAGCHQLMFGIESASPVVLANIRKGTDLARAEEAVRLTQRAGIDVRAAFMLGNPGETEETLAETLAFAIKLDPEIAVFNITTPYPGTEMFAWADERGYLTTRDWDRYDVAHPVMELPTISSDRIQAFYRKAYRRFYFRPAYVWKQLKRLRSLDELRSRLRALRGVLGVG